MDTEYAWVTSLVVSPSVFVTANFTSRVSPGFIPCSCDVKSAVLSPVNPSATAATSPEPWPCTTVTYRAIRER